MRTRRTPRATRGARRLGGAQPTNSPVPSPNQVQYRSKDLVDPSKGWAGLSSAAALDTGIVYTTWLAPSPQASAVLEFVLLAEASASGVVGLGVEVGSVDVAEREFSFLSCRGSER
jgi:hypothetical protein